MLERDAPVYRCTGVVEAGIQSVLLSLIDLFGRATCGTVRSQSLDTGFVMSVSRFIGPSFCLVLAAGCAAPEGESVGDSGLLNALAQIRAVNLPLELGDPVLQPELGHKLELQHDMTDTMAPRAFAELAD